MFYFNCDYMEGCHPNILKRLQEENLVQYVGYSEDEICGSARNRIRIACGRDDLDVHFIVGGTQTNLISIAYALRPYEAVISASAGHIATHETGAIEATGHKVITVDGKDSKITPEDISRIMEEYNNSTTIDHIVKPKMVYTSLPTEYGAIYSKKELIAIYETCRKYDIYLYIDGARLGYALGCSENDLTLSDITEYSDYFYIGGTKCGALIGEALVIKNPELKPNFRALIKQRGAMLAKGKVLGIQFDELFKDDLYVKINTHAVEQANDIRDTFAKKGIEVVGNSPTNQIFVNLSDADNAKLSEKVGYSVWGPADNGLTTYRFVTSWATSDEAVEELKAAINSL